MSDPSMLPAPPWMGLRHRLLEQAAERAACGDAAGAAVLRALVETWWQEQERWNSVARDLLRAHHEINNALVGVSGNVQLLLLGPAGDPQRLRDRLQVVLRESERIERAVQSMQPFKAALEASPPEPRRGGPPHGLDAANAA